MSPPDAALIAKAYTTVFPILEKSKELLQEAAKRACQIIFAGVDGGLIGLIVGAVVSWLMGKVWHAKEWAISICLRLEYCLRLGGKASWAKFKKVLQPLARHGMARSGSPARLWTGHPSSQRSVSASADCVRECQPQQNSGRVSCLGRSPFPASVGWAPGACAALAPKHTAQGPITVLLGLA